MTDAGRSPPKAAAKERRTHLATRREPLSLELGGRLAQVQVAYRTFGKLNDRRDNAVVVCHPLTRSADLDDWWADMLGGKGALDPARDFVICSNTLGSCFGTTGPSSLDPETGKPHGPNFPAITIRDTVALQQWLVTEELGLEEIHTVIGAGLGAMQALEWVVTAPRRVRELVVIGGCGRQSAWGIGLSESQRCAIFGDPAFKAGHYSAKAPPTAGLAIAGMIAKCASRSRPSFESRFGRKLQGGQRYAVESFLHDQGLELARRFDANSYMTLTRAMDSHDLGRGRGEYESILAGIKTRTLVVSIPTDVLHPIEEQVELARGLPHARLVHLRSAHGHEAFELEAKELGKLVAAFRG
jgi:homoserine O-acetyltransferase/O-succinyltransferase